MRSDDGTLPSSATNPNHSHGRDDWTVARYVSGMVFGNHRLISISGGQITFFHKDYRSGGRTKVATLSAEEFIDRFLSHVLPGKNAAEALLWIPGGEPAGAS